MQICADDPLQRGGAEGHEDGRRAPELAGWVLPSGRQKEMRFRRKKIPDACRQQGANHAVSVRACSSAMPWLAKRSIDCEI
jgi:hypothetical protein